MNVGADTDIVFLLTQQHRKYEAFLMLSSESERENALTIDNGWEGSVGNTGANYSLCME